MKALKWIIMAVVSLTTLSAVAQNDFTDDAYLTPSQARKLREKKEAEYREMQKTRAERLAQRKAEEDKYRSELTDWYNRRDMKVTIEEMEDNLDRIDEGGSSRVKGGEYSRRLRRFHDDNTVVLQGVDRVYIVDDADYDPWYDSYYGYDSYSNVSIHISTGPQLYYGWRYRSPYYRSYAYPWYDGWYGGWYGGWYDPFYYDRWYPGYYGYYGYYSPWYHRPYYGGWYGSYNYGYSHGYYNGYYDSYYGGYAYSTPRRNYSSGGRGAGTYQGDAYNTYGRGLGRNSGNTYREYNNSNNTRSERNWGNGRGYSSEPRNSQGRNNNTYNSGGYSGGNNTRSSGGGYSSGSSGTNRSSSGGSSSGTRSTGSSRRSR